MQTKNAKESEILAKVTVGAVNPEPGSSKNYKTGSWRTLRPKIDFEKCTKKCWFCYDFCPDSSVEKTEDGPKIIYEYCKGCGICAYECPKEAIEMESEEK
ncbi:MAG: 4Fe-4S binding protein [Thermoplasmata archaeon]|nr:MAG: 4Fe-4S binding protein [Thermoplasmata archaeon]